TERMLEGVLGSLSSVDLAVDSVLAGLPSTERMLEGVLDHRPAADDEPPSGEGTIDAAGGPDVSNLTSSLDLWLDSVLAPEGPGADGVLGSPLAGESSPHIEVSASVAWRTALAALLSDCPRPTMKQVGAFGTAVTVVAAVMFDFLPGAGAADVYGWATALTFAWLLLRYAWRSP
ncbi:hypothetical protein ACFUMH_15275, partial [Cellulomonas sp. NPDC057328]|uniref:hypothetical protein n=1 Tax=Cellulomonas sp. NPDC057328 TaxID=3346101 RepID=UPI00363DB477